MRTEGSLLLAREELLGRGWCRGDSGERVGKGRECVLAWPGPARSREGGKFNERNTPQEVHLGGLRNSTVVDPSCPALRFTHVIEFLWMNHFRINAFIHFL